MGKVLKIILWIVVLSVIYIWFSTVFNSCSADAEGSESIIDDTEALIEDVGDGIEEVSADSFEDEELDYSDSGEEDFEDFEEEIVEEIIDEEDIDPEPPARYTKNTSTTKTYSTSSGSYMLIAGNYLVETNAGSMRSKLSNLGYGSAEIAVFDNSPYHTVIAQRYSDYNSAFRASNDLKDKGIECYVKKRS